MCFNVSFAFFESKEHIKTRNFQVISNFQYSKTLKEDIFINKQAHQRKRNYQVISKVQYFDS